MAIRLLTLGTLQAFLDDDELTALPGQPLRAALLVYLGVERRAARETVATVFWPESDEEAARHALRQALYNLRRQLRNGWLEQHAVELRVTSALDCDAHAFEAALGRHDLPTAAALYSGPFLHGINLLGLTSWQQWVDGRRGTYANRFRRCCRDWVDARVADGDLDGAIAAARKWIAPDPLDDEGQHRLIEVLALGGERNEAIRQYELYARLLEPEGLTPLDGTQELLEKLRRAELPSAPRRPAVSPESQPADAAQSRPATAMAPAPPADASAVPGGAIEAGSGIETSETRGDRVRWRRYFLRVASPALVVLAIGLIITRTGTGEGVVRARNPALDTSRYAVLPILDDSTVPAGTRAAVYLEDALAQWSGISVVPAFQVGEAVARREAPLSLRDAREIAVALRAGRFTSGFATRVGDSIRVQVGLFDTGTGERLAVSSLKLPLDVTGAPTAFNALAERLLFRRGGTGGRVIARPPTWSQPARAAYDAGHQAIRSWDLPAAESAFSRSVAHDAEFAHAHLWLAQVRAWQDQPAAAWHSNARRAADRRDQLGPDDQRHASALLAAAGGDRPTACAHFEELTRRDEASFVGWYGLARCLAGDSVVLPDRSSASGWRFRSSYHRALTAYQRAFQTLPSIHRAMRSNSYDRVRRLFFISRAQPRPGRSLPPDTMRFYAYPDLDRGTDTLIFTPWPEIEFQRGLTALPSSIDMAVQRQRLMFHEIATAWRAAFPESADALEALAISYEMLRDRRAIGTIREARRLAALPGDRLRIAAAEVWIRLKFSIPDDAEGVMRARVLADSLLAGPPDPHEDPRALVSLAVLTGRAALGARLARDERVIDAWDVPAPLGMSASPLLVFAALGGPPDSVLVLEQQVVRGLASMLRHEQAPARTSWLVLSATLAYPDARMISLDSLPDRLAVTQRAFMYGDLQTVRDSLSAVAARRVGRPAYELTFDALYPEAALHAAMGDRHAAIRWLDPSLEDLAGAAPRVFADPARVGGLVRAMALRARLAHQAGDRRSAERWARIVVELWSDSDAFLQPPVAEMRQILDGVLRTTPHPDQDP
jgi:DNA-binding SARP family transcriptional activator